MKISPGCERKLESHSSKSSKNRFYSKMIAIREKAAQFRVGSILHTEKVAGGLANKQNEWMESRPFSRWKVWGGQGDTKPT